MKSTIEGLQGGVGKQGNAINFIIFKKHRNKAKNNWGTTLGTRKIRKTREHGLIFQGSKRTKLRGNMETHTLGRLSLLGNIAPVFANSRTWGFCNYAQ